MTHGEDLKEELALEAVGNLLQLAALLGDQSVDRRDVGAGHLFASALEDLDARGGITELVVLAH